MDFEDFSNLFGKFWSHMLLFCPKIATNMITFHSGPVRMARKNRGSYKTALRGVDEGPPFSQPLKFSDLPFGIFPGSK